MNKKSNFFISNIFLISFIVIVLIVGTLLIFSLKPKEDTVIEASCPVGIKSIKNPCPNGNGLLNTFVEDSNGTKYGCWECKQWSEQKGS